jgi:BirA family transcriptional regulator, biotin operon repressor / biotin---[acetyl-CoA-carboxylase] ligase
VHEPLIAEKIRMHLSPVGLDLCGRIHVFEALDSTNNWLAAHVRAEHPGRHGGEVCLAETQTAGRGRRGRSWASPASGNLYLSLAWRVMREERDSGAATLAIGVAVAEALSDISNASLGLKWPNDVYADRRKLGGILVELVSRGTERYWIVGIGVNLSAPPLEADAFPQPAGLTEFWPEAGVHRNRLAGAIIDGVFQACMSYENEGFAPVLPKWDSYDLAREREVDIQTADGRFMRGVGGGVDSRGRLRVLSAGREYWLHAGEVSLRIN